MFWLLLSSTCAVSKLSGFPTQHHLLWLFLSYFLCLLNYLYLHPQVWFFFHLGFSNSLPALLQGAVSGGCVVLSCWPGSAPTLLGVPCPALYSHRVFPLMLGLLFANGSFLQAKRGSWRSIKWRLFINH